VLRAVAYDLILLKQKNNVKSDPLGAKSVENLYENEV